MLHNYCAEHGMEMPGAVLTPAQVLDLLGQKVQGTFSSDIKYIVVAGIVFCLLVLNPVRVACVAIGTLQSSII